MKISCIKGIRTCKYRLLGITLQCHTFLQETTANKGFVTPKTTVESSTKTFFLKHNIFPQINVQCMLPAHAIQVSHSLHCKCRWNPQCKRVYDYFSQVWSQKLVFISCYRSSQVFSGVLALLVCLETSCDTQTVLYFQIFDIYIFGFP